MSNHDGKGYLLTINFYKGSNYAALLVPNKRNMEGKVSVHPEGTTVNKQEQKTTKKLTTQKIHANNIHAKLVHPGEERMYATKNHLHYTVNAILEVFEYCDVVKIKKKLLSKVVEERYLNPENMIHLYLI